MSTNLVLAGFWHNLATISRELRHRGSWRRNLSANLALAGSRHIMATFRLGGKRRRRIMVYRTKSRGREGCGCVTLDSPRKTKCLENTSSGTRCLMNDGACLRKIWPESRVHCVGIEGGSTSYDKGHTQYYKEQVSLSEDGARSASKAAENKGKKRVKWADELPTW